MGVLEVWYGQSISQGLERQNSSNKYTYLHLTLSPVIALRPEEPQIFECSQIL